MRLSLPHPWMLHLCLRRVSCFCHDRSPPPPSHLPPRPPLPLAEACSLTGGCIEDCLKGGLQVFDPPWATSPFGIFIIPVLPFPGSNDQCSCLPIMGTTDANNTRFDGRYGDVPVDIFLKTNAKITNDIVFTVEDCN